MKIREKGKEEIGRKRWEEYVEEINIILSVSYQEDIKSAFVEMN